ncbi:MAG TPA: hypothetical protein VMM36_15260 [Opitutaceae bacterium]|nr:hypothetical protein [Opitutaceae bacterium]
MPKLDAEKLLAAIASNERPRRHRATLVLGGLEPKVDIDVQVLIEGLRSNNDDVVFWSEVALKRLGERSAPAIPVFIELLNREPQFIQQSAVDCLVGAGPRDPAARKAVFGVFHHPDWSMRLEALTKCINLPDHTPDELAAIARMADDPHPQVAEWSGGALRIIRIRKETPIETVPRPPKERKEGQVDPDRFFAELNRILRTRVTFRAGLSEILSWCAQSMPHTDWEKVSAIDVSDDERRAKQWLPDLLKKEPCPFPIRGVYFSLVELSNSRGEEIAELSAAFVGQYDPNDTEMLWAIGDLRHDPKRGSFKGRALKAAGLIFNRASGRGLQNDGYFPFAFSLSALLARSLMTPEIHDVLGSPRGPVGVLVGWEAGDHLLLGELKRVGFKFIRHPV